MATYRANQTVFGLRPQDKFEHFDEEAMAPFVLSGVLSIVDEDPAEDVVVPAPVRGGRRKPEPVAEPDPVEAVVPLEPTGQVVESPDGGDDDGSNRVEPSSTESSADLSDHEGPDA